MPRQTEKHFNSYVWQLVESTLVEQVLVREIKMDIEWWNLKVFCHFFFLRLRISHSRSGNYCVSDEDCNYHVRCYLWFDMCALMFPMTLRQRGVRVVRWVSRPRNQQMAQRDSKNKRTNCGDIVWSCQHKCALTPCRTHIFLTASLRGVQTSTYTHGSRCLQCGLSYRSISPSPFSCFISRPCCSRTVTSKPYSRRHCPRRTFPLILKARVKRTSARAPRSLATWPIPRTPQVMSPRSSTKSLL